MHSFGRNRFVENKSIVKTESPLYKAQKNFKKTLRWTKKAATNVA